MQLFHASDLEVKAPKIINRFATLDFGTDSDSQLATLLGTCLIPAIIKELKIPDNEQIEFLNKFYQSSLYDILIQEETALWHLSPTTLAKIYEYEQETGILELPEEL